MLQSGGASRKEGRCDPTAPAPADKRRRPAMIPVPDSETFGGAWAVFGGTPALPVSLGLLGLIVGSFLAAVSVRLPAEEDVVARPSACRACGRRLKPWNLIPLVSWLVQKGRCAACGASISFRYPLIEAGAGVIGLWAGLHGGADPWLGLATALLGWQLLLIAVVDGEHFWLPDVLTWPLALSGLIAAGLRAGGAPWDQVLGAALGFGLLWLVGEGYRRVRGRQGLGGGDPFLFGGTGAWVGWMGLPSVLLWAAVGGLSVVAARLLLRRPVRGDDRLPFGVFLAGGAWLVRLFGPLGLQG